MHKQSTEGFAENMQRKWKVRNAKHIPLFKVISISICVCIIYDIDNTYMYACMYI